MQAVAHLMRERNGRTRIAYVHSERFVSDMVSALQRNTINAFKNAYRSLDALLVDDIQFFASKERSQEEFFHTFNELFESQHQIILTCDRYPKSVSDMEDRLKSRFACGLTVAVQHPDPETCAAIVVLKAHNAGVVLPEEVALFLGTHIRSSVRELEGALRRVIAYARFTGEAITVELTQIALRDLFASRARRLTIEHVQTAVAGHFKLRVSDLVSQRRSRSVARPRQLAMALAKELTSHSLPEIGAAFGGRDHTTVIHACKRINELCASDEDLKQSHSTRLRDLAGK